MLRRAYSVLQVKSVDEERRTISGLATTPTPDVMNDVVEPAGARFSLPIALLWQHKSDQPIGHVTAATVKDAGIAITATLAKSDTPGLLKDRLDMAWDSIKLGLVRGLSIGFKAIEEAYNQETQGYHILQWEWYELSAVTLPANTECTITAIKSADIGLQVKGVVPPNVSSVLAPKAESWSGPTLSDFTAKSWADLTDAEKRHIAGHYAWAAADPPATFGDLKLGHHDPKDGDVVWHGVVAAAGRLDQTDLPSADVAAVKAHLAHHYAQFKETPPWAPKAAAAASGTGRPSHPSGVSDKSRVVTMRTDRPMKKSYADMIADWVATRKEKTDRIDALLTKSGEAGVTLDAAEAEESDTLEADVKKIDEQLTRLRAAETREKDAALAVRGGTPDDGSRSRTNQRITIEKKLPPGIRFAQYAMCIAKAKGSTSDAVALAKQFYPDDSGLEAAIRVKAAVGAGAALTSHWADDLVPYNILVDDFINYLRPGNIVDKFGQQNPGTGMVYPMLRKVPFNVRVSGFSAGLTGYWVQEGLPTPLSKATSFNTTLTWNKVEGIVVLTQEEIRFSNPSAEAKVRDDIAKAINTRIDVDFVDPAKAATANVSPASITNAVVATTPTSTTAAALITDLATVLKQFPTNNLDTADLVIIMSASMALQISMMTTTLGLPYFKDITMQGGMLRGIPVLTSENLTSVGSPGTQTIVAVKASEVYLADDGNVSIDASNEASLEMLDGSLQQTAIAGTGASLVSLWQNGLLGLKAQREITWKMRRTTAVQYLSPAAYTA